MKDLLLGKTLKELQEIGIQFGMPRYIADQLIVWLYKTQIVSFDEMTNISKINRNILAENFDLGVKASLKVQESVDGTKKYLFPALENKFIESAYIPDETRSTLCVSTQVGCKMGCLFCMTGKQGFQGNLKSGEIINQLRSLPEYERVTNLVFMGMGEPFDNIPEVMKSLEILTSEYGFHMSVRKITVSTIGIIPGIRTFLEESKCNLAISLHSPFDEERRKLMPVQHVYPIKDVLETLQQYDINRYRKVSFEYIMFKGINDTPRHVKELARLLNKVRCRINLLRFHTVPNVPLESSDDATIMAFQKMLNEKGIIATIRQSRGMDIDAACGMLSTKEIVKNFQIE